MSKTSKDSKKNKKKTKKKADSKKKRAAQADPLPVRRYNAAGGVVIHQGQMLLLDRPGRKEVRLPKGHIEDDEIPADTAVRETAEESGYGDLSIVADLGSQVVTFDYKGAHYARTEFYFLMHLNSHERVDQPQSDQVQFTPLWVDLDEAVARLTFPAEQDVAQRAIAIHRAQVEDG